MSLHGYANIERGETNLQMARLEQISHILGIELKDLINLDGKNILNNIFSSECNFTNCCNSSSKGLEYELEKCQLIIEQQNKEITYLKEIIHLMNKPTG